MIREAWPFRVPLREDELLSSFLIRNAHAHGTTPYSFLSYYWPGKQVWNRDLDRTTDQAWLNELEALVGVPAEQLEASTLLPFRRILGSALRNGDTPLLLSVSVFHRTRLRHGLQYCPTCFAEGHHWFRRIWRLGFVFVCPEHGSALVDACPACGSPVVPHRSLRLDLSRCHQCGTCLGSNARTKLPSSGVLEWQRWLLGVSLNTATGAGPFDPQETFTSVRSLLSILTIRRVHSAIREALHLPVAPTPESRLQFEHARATEREVLMETLTAWLSDWPSTFRLGASAARLTQRTFSRRRQPATLRCEVARLPLGIERNRQYMPRVFDARLLRLARTDKKAYRALRAWRLQELAGLA